MKENMKLLAMVTVAAVLSACALDAVQDDPHEGQPDESAQAELVESQSENSEEEIVAEEDENDTGPEVVACTIHIGPTSRSGNTITGYGSQEGCGSNGTSYLVIQRHRWYGWQDLKTKTVVGSGHDVYVNYNCSGTGTHTYRTIHFGNELGGGYKFKASNQITATCN